MLSMPVCFSVVLKQDVWKVAFNKRQSVVQDFASLKQNSDAILHGGGPVQNANGGSAGRSQAESSKPCNKNC